MESENNYFALETLQWSRAPRAVSQESPQRGQFRDTLPRPPLARPVISPLRILWARIKAARLWCSLFGASFGSGSKMLDGGDGRVLKSHANDNGRAMERFHLAVALAALRCATAASESVYLRLFISLLWMSFERCLFWSEWHDTEAPRL
jgi:hypothetical protein